jgi:hypothetical protein
MMDPIRDAIDKGGGQTCNIEGVLLELDAAGYVIVPKEMLERAASCLDRGAYDLRDGGYLRSASLLDDGAAEIRAVSV